MKYSKIFAVLLLFGLLTGCALNFNRSAVGKFTMSSPTSQYDMATVAPTVEVTVEPTSEKHDAKVDVVQEVHYVWSEFKKFHIYVACELKNTGDVPVYIGSYTATVYASDGSVLQTVAMYGAIPIFLQPGETSLVDGFDIIDNMKKADEAKKVEISGDFTEANAKTTFLKTSKVKFFKPADKYSGSKVTGIVENSTDSDADNIVVVCGVYDKSNKLLGVLREIVTSKLKPGKSAGFTATVISEPPDMYKKVSSVKTIAVQFSITGE